VNSKNQYTFGDSERAERRLALLARAFAAPSRALVERYRPESLELALDLGSGPGHTTRLVHEASRAERTIGIDSSARYVEQARRDAAPGVEFVEHDLLTAPYPVPPARLAFCRFLITHVSDPVAALSAFRALLTADGTLLLQETGALDSDTPVFRRYYELVGQLQRHYGQALYVGRELESLARRAGYTVVYAGEARFEQPAATMAELHAMNLPSWRQDPFAQQAFDARELDELEAALGRIGVGLDDAPPIRMTLSEVALRLG
jgi:trans-aconitate 2-methyltransferase